MYGAYERSAEVYDLVYSQMLDYEANAARLCELVEERVDGAETLLEVACGTGAYLEPLSRSYLVTGVDLSPLMLEQARRRLPGAQLVEADMTSLDLGRTFDVVVCLFSSIAYVQTLEGLRSTIAGFARHLAPGGLVILEPWFPPEQWNDGYVGAISARNDEMAVGRVTTSRRHGHLVTMTFAFTVARPGGEVESFVEEHATGQFTIEEHLEAFAAAGLVVDHDPDGLMGRGLYLASWPPG
ncbi:MAG: class I SAM-dependent DNA methyltransferase [Acidimicrobiia bacterium]